MRPKQEGEVSQFTYVRYNQLFKYQKDYELLVDSQIPFPHRDLILQELPMEKITVMQPLLEFGRKYAEKVVDVGHLR